MATGGRSSGSAAAPEPIRVFVCYRRSDDKNFIGRLYDWLTVRFEPGNVFRDIDSIPKGRKFSDVIDETLENVHAVVAVIGPTWHGERLFDERDFVRRELLEALRRGVPILPVLIEDTSLPDESQVPEELRPLLGIEFARVRGDPDFQRDITKAIEAIIVLAREEQQRRRLAAEAAAEKAAAEEAARRRLSAAQAAEERLAHERVERAAEIRRLEAEFASRRLAEEQARLAELTETQEAARAEAEEAAEELRRIENSSIVPDSTSPGSLETFAAGEADQSAPTAPGGESMAQPTDVPDAAGVSTDSTHEQTSEVRDPDPSESPAAPIAEAEPTAQPPSRDPPPRRSSTAFLRDHPAAAVAATIVIVAASVVTAVAITRDDEPSGATEPTAPIDTDTGTSLETPGTGTTGGTESEGTGGLAGTTVTISGAVRSGEAADEVGVALNEFAEQNQMTITLESVDDETQLEAQLDDDNPPDIALIGGQQLFSQLVADGALVEVPEDVTESVAEYWPEDWLTFWNDGGRQFGVPIDSGLRSLVWYVPSAFEEGGYDVPETLTEFFELIDEMAVDGKKPLCVGIESSYLIGSPFTEWVEELILRRHGIDYYRRWYAHEIPFADGDVVGAMDEVANLWASDKVHIENGSLDETRPRDSALALLGGSCMMYHSNARLAQLFPLTADFGTGPGDVYAFSLPSDEDQPAIVSSGGAGAIRDAPEVWAVMEYLGSPQYADARQRAAQETGTSRPSGFLTANLGVDRALFTDIENEFLDMLADASPLAPIASGQMPPEIGAGVESGNGAFVVETTALANGEKGAEAAAAAIDAAWPD